MYMRNYMLTMSSDCVEIRRRDIKTRTCKKKGREALLILLVKDYFLTNLLTIGASDVSIRT